MAYFFIHCGLIHPAMVLVIGQLLDHRTTGRTSRLGHLMTCLLLLSAIGLSLLISITFWLQYGIMGVLLGPLKETSINDFCKIARILDSPSSPVCNSDFSTAQIPRNLP